MWAWLPLPRGTLARKSAMSSFSVTMCTRPEPPDEEEEEDEEDEEEEDGDDRAEELPPGVDAAAASRRAISAEKGFGDMFPPCAAAAPPPPSPPPLWSALELEGGVDESPLGTRRWPRPVFTWAAAGDGEGAGSFARTPAADDEDPPASATYRSYSARSWDERSE